MNACLSCFLSNDSDDDDGPLLPGHSHESGAESQPDEPLHKLVDILAAFSVGKLPSQDQINNLFRRALKSGVLTCSKDAQFGVSPEDLRGKGPYSKAGRKIISDLEEIIQALLQFGMEKNDDDLLQELFFQLYQIDMDESLVSLGGASAKPETDTKTHFPQPSEVISDARALINATRTLYITYLTSSTFRLILTDAISIGQEFLVHVASDIQSASIQVADLAESVEQRVRQSNSDLDSGPRQMDSLKKVIALLDGSEDAAWDVAQGLREVVEAHKREWEGTDVDAAEQVKKKLLIRIQKLVAQVQEDPSSRRAVIAILQIIRKYTSILQETMAKTDEDPSSPKNRQRHSGPEDGFCDSSHPAQRYSPPSPTVLIPGIEVSSPRLQRAFYDAKEMTERIAQGHSVNSMLRSLKSIIRLSMLGFRRLGKNLQKSSCEKVRRDGDGSSAGVNRCTEQIKQMVDNESGNSSTSSETITEKERHRGDGERESVFVLFFSSVGRYLDKALREPEWAASDKGRELLGMLYDATWDVLHLAGDVVADAEEAVQMSLDQTKEEIDVELGKGKGKQEEYHTGEARSGASTRKMRQENSTGVTSPFVQQLVRLFREAGNYLDAVEGDKATMRLIRAVETLREDIAGLFGEDRKQTGQAAGEMKSHVRHPADKTPKLGLYTQWLGWALPRVLDLLPLDAIPIPRVELKTNKFEGAVEALWIRGLARGLGASGAPGGRYEGSTLGARWQSEADAGDSTANFDEGGVSGKLIPDEILVKHSTEFRVNFAEGLGAIAVGVGDVVTGVGSGTRARQCPCVESVSKLKVHMDGIKACVCGTGYYFKYNGLLCDYEDEGILSIDLGTGSGRHSGLNVGIELEVDSSDVDMDLNPASGSMEVPLLVVEDVDTDSCDSDGPQNLDVQEAVAGAAQCVSSMRIEPSKIPIDIALTNVVPLFKVLDVDIDMRGIKFKLDHSRHWILNKLFVQPFGGGIVAAAAKRELEKSVRRGLEAISRGLALILTEAKKRAANRVKVVAKNSDDKSLTESSLEMEDGKIKMGDLWTVLLARGAEVLKHYAEESPGRQHNESRYTRTSMETGKKGLVYSSSTWTPTPTEQPIYGIPPPTMEETMRWGIGADQMCGAGELSEVTVAVGLGAQLFPGKGGPYSVSKDTVTGKNSVLRGLREGVGRQVREGIDNVKEEGQRMLRERENEHGDDWRSSAFDL